MRRMTIFMKKDVIHYGILVMIAGCSFLWFWPLRGLIGHYYVTSAWQEERFSQRDLQLTPKAVEIYQSKIPQERFSIRWDGWIHIEKTGNYTFCIETRHHASLTLDTTVQVVENTGVRSLTKKCGEIRLPVGLHSIDIRYAQQKGAPSLHVSWITPDSGSQKRPLPPLALYPSPFPFRGIGFVSRHLQIVYPALWVLFLLNLLIKRHYQHQIPPRKQLKALFDGVVGMLCFCLFFAFAKSVLNLHLAADNWLIYVAPILLTILVATRWRLKYFRITSLLLCIALGLGVALFFQQQLIFPLHYHNRNTFYAPLSLMMAWRPRFFSYYLANLFVTHQPGCDGFSPIPVAQWSSVWFLAISLLIIFAKYRSRHAYLYLYLFGLYAAISYGYMPGIVDRVYPWDMPALFVFTLAILLIDRSLFMPLLILLPIGMGFKETAMTLSVAFLFEEMWSWKRRILTCGVTMALCVGMKIAVMMITAPSPVFLTMTHHIQQKALFLHNVDWCLAQWRTQLSPLFINAGTFLALLCLPLINKKMTMLKLIALVFAVGNFLFAVIWEYRVWFEIIPVTLLGFELYASHPCKEKSQKICVS